ncbi:uncharacterized protein UBRO_20449 [Ustilago bromivora]|uniref:Uncharacterized protein n=1 Tax=Ustilago bromivora TaxID=307758 RepID=A0A1K0H0F4_9BASI|nr:uncharacterized protein UBRO_20449 [Ustilago bromivora]
MTTTTDDSLDISAQPETFPHCLNLVLQVPLTFTLPVQIESLDLPQARRTSLGQVPTSSALSQSSMIEIFKLIFPGAPVKPNHIKAKLRWLQETYYKEKKKLSLTGAGMLLEDMDASNLSYASCLALSTKYAWFEKMHKMMNGRSSAEPATLITTPSLNFTSNDKAGMPPYGSAEIPMDLSGSEPYDHSTHGHGLPPILDLMDSTNPPAAIASTSGGSIAGAGDDDIFTTPFPSQAQPSFSAAGGLDVFESSSSSSSAPLSPSTKHKCERMLEAEHTKHEEMHMQHKREEKEHDKCVHVHDHDIVMEMVRLLASQASGEKDTHQNTSNNNNTDSSFNLPAL